MSTPEKKSRGGGRVAFLKHRESISELIAAGHVARSIYDQLGGDEKLGISYSQFMRYVNKFIIPGKNHDVQATASPRAPLATRAGSAPAPPAPPYPAEQQQRPANRNSDTPVPRGRPGAQPRIQHSSVAPEKDDLI